MVSGNMVIARVISGCSLSHPKQLREVCTYYYFELYSKNSFTSVQGLLEAVVHRFGRLYSDSVWGSGDQIFTKAAAFPIK